jgi:hypothetical protein
LRIYYIFFIFFRYHPFYICDSPEGGFGQKKEDQQLKQTVYAGVDYDSENYPFPTAGKSARCSLQDGTFSGSNYFKFKPKERVSDYRKTKSTRI